MAFDDGEVQEKKLAPRVGQRVMLLLSESPKIDDQKAAEITGASVKTIRNGKILLATNDLDVLNAVLVEGAPIEHMLRHVRLPKELRDTMDRLLYQYGETMVRRAVDELVDKARSGSPEEGEPDEDGNDSKPT